MILVAPMLTFLRTFLFAALLLLVRPEATFAESGPSEMIIIRHAEPATGSGGDPSLSEAGRKRAEALRMTLHDAGVVAIITSEFRRARETAQPLAADLALTPVVVSAGNGLAAHIKAIVAAAQNQREGTVLIVGHSDTVSRVIETFGGPRLPQLCEESFDRLFVLVSVAGKMLLTRARYGDASPASHARCL
jgi:phosphohistidine phosphatase SixA